MGSVTDIDLKETPKVVAAWAPMLAANAAHLARLLKAETCPGLKKP